MQAQRRQADNLVTMINRHGDLRDFVNMLRWHPDKPEAKFADFLQQFLEEDGRTRAFQMQRIMRELHEIDIAKRSKILKAAAEQN